MPLYFKIIEEQWTSKGISLKHLRVFTMHVACDWEHKDKFDANAIKCHLIGYENDNFGYHLFDAYIGKLSKPLERHLVKENCMSINALLSQGTKSL